LFSVFYQVRGNDSAFRAPFLADSQQPLQLFLLFLYEIDKLYAKPKSVLVVPNLTF
jgi:hypothetical protein